MELDIIVVVGSLREGSYNRALARAVEESPPAGVRFRRADISGIPVFNDDLRRSQGEPEHVRSLVAAIREADGVLVVSPEYNYSIPGVLKNAIDWASYGAKHPFKGKPMAIMGASTGRFGTTRMQRELRYILGGLGALVLPKPEVMVPEARSRFDENGRLIDEATRERAIALVEAFAEWIATVRAGSPATASR